jgi:hypothetical protein
VAANSGNDAALNSSVNTQSMSAVLRGPELSDFAVTVKHLDLSFHQGQLDLIEAAMLVHLPLLFRILAKSEQLIIRRSATFVTLAEYQHVLGAYFGRAFAIDCASNSVPIRAANFVIGAAGVKSLISLDFTFDMFNGPNGLLHLQQLIAGGSLKFTAINKLDFWCQIQYIDGFHNYFGRFLTSIGVPPTVPPSDSGYTLATWCTAYKSALTIVITLPTEEEQYALLKQLHDIFISFLKCASSEISRVAYSSAPDTARFGSLMAPDAPPAIALDRLVKQYQKYNDHRELTEMFQRKAPTQTVSLLTYPDHSRLAAKHGDGGSKSQSGGRREHAGSDSGAARKRGLDQPSSEPKAQTPGSASKEAVVLNKIELLISGWIWNTASLGEAFGEAGKCWPFVLSKKMSDNRQAHCPCHSKAGHESATSAAHTPLKVHKTLPVFDPFDQDQMDLYGRKPTMEEMKLVVRAFPTPPREPPSGKRHAEDGRRSGTASGRGSGGGAGRPNFRQPKAA